MKASEIAYRKLEFLAVKYANKLYSYEELSMEREDLLQEFRLKIFTSIKAYGRRWLAYRRGTASRPVPLRYYVECACSNKCTDMMRAISKENYKLRIDQTNYDCGVEDNVYIDTERDKFVINGVDVLHNLTGIRRAIFSLYIKGRGRDMLARMLRTPRAVAEGFGNLSHTEAKTVVDEIVSKQKEYLLDNYKTALYYTPTRFECYRMNNDD